MPRPPNMPVPKIDSREKWIRYKAEKYVAEGKPELEAYNRAERDWEETYQNKFILDDYPKRTESKEQK